jgi:hypothetical protein
MKRFATALFSLVLIIALTSVAQADTQSFDKQMLPILEQYLKIPKVLAADKTDGVIEAAKEIVKLAAKLDASGVSGEHAKHYKSVPQTILSAAKELAEAKTITSMRDALKELSKPMVLWATLSKPKGLSVMYCSMAPGSWLQKDDTTISNPYYGAKMLRCGEIVGGEGAKTESAN